jgi:hypothetical protein
MPGGEAILIVEVTRFPSATSCFSVDRNDAGLSRRHKAVKPYDRLNRHIFDPMFESGV